jgi:hypothetical protein
MEGVSDDGHGVGPMFLRGQNKAPIVQPGLMYVRGSEHSDAKRFLIHHIGFPVSI